ncbi:MAG: hypothetical protein J7J31_08465 [Helicobacteraceae bacterium]|nr:hypothetical protein [Helicobacteraceae bacterium]
MRDFHSIIEYLKEYLADAKKVKILDKDVAKALEISQSNFATIKKRNATPYEKILRFCQKEQLCCRELFFDEV